MTRAFAILVGLAATLLVSCGGNGGAPSARIVVFTASDERVPRGTPVTLQWQAADAGVQDGLPSCELTRRWGDDPNETEVRTTCSGTATEVPSAPPTATAVHYRFKVLKQPFDASDPYLSETRSITLDPPAYAIGAGGTGRNEARGVSTLADGSAIITGTFFSTAFFGATTLTSAGDIDAFVARVDPNGTWAWATRAGGAGSTRMLDVSTLADGSAIVTGFYSGTASFGATTLTSAGNLDVFVARVDPDGSWEWATSAGGTSDARAYGVSTLGNGSAIITGGFSGTATFGATTLASAGSADVFVARVDPDGSWSWATSAGGTGLDEATSISTRADGSAIITGNFEGTATVGDTNLTSAGLSDVFVARVDPDGSWEWATRAGGTSFDRAFGISTLTDGGAIVTGRFEGSATFGDTNLTSAGGIDVFVARVDPDGTWAWATSAGGADTDQPSDVSTLADGSAIITGYFQGSATFGTSDLTSAGNNDVFVARVDPDGTWAWATRAGGTSNDVGRSVSPLADGGALITGDFEGTASFGANDLTSAGSLDVFVARIGADGAW